MNVHWSGPTWVRSGLFEHLNLVGPVPVPVLGLRGQNPDWTGLSNTTRRSGVQGMFGQEAEVLPARVVEGAGGDEAIVEEEVGQRGAGGQGGWAVGVGEWDEGRWRG